MNQSKIVNKIYYKFEGQFDHEDQDQGHRFMK